METITKRQVDGNIVFIPGFFSFLTLPMKWTAFWQKQTIEGIKIMQRRTNGKKKNLD